mmetsp:Transcript_21748/g.29165  ORF Transcript_21748/g.29165 Transcript_21748/m.29165 type:complete len:84 (-) Transcript_21748:594-845(-)
MLSNPILNMRRITMLFMALLLHEYGVLHLQVYILINCVTLYQAFVVRPSTSNALNAMNKVNEVVSVLIACLLLVQQDLRFEPP